jgi:hypothetical protein
MTRRTLQKRVPKSTSKRANGEIKYIDLIYNMHLKRSRKSKRHFRRRSIRHLRRTHNRKGGGKAELEGGGRKHKKPVATPADVAPPTRAQLLEGRLALVELLQQLRADLAARGEDDYISTRMRHVQKEINEIDFQLKTPEEQEAILAQRRGASVASAAFKQERHQTALDKEEARKLEQQTKEDHLRRERFLAQSRDERQRVEEWEQEHLSQLQNKSFVQSELDGLRTRHEALTGDGQPKGAAAGYPVWYNLMVELLRKYGGV